MMVNAVMVRPMRFKTTSTAKTVWILTMASMP
jgi:hypothetical protein